MSIQDNLKQITEVLPAHCKLVAVSKTHSPESILEAYSCGQRHFGENKVQELLPKYEALPKDICWHMVGHLQTNKVKYIAPFIYMIHSVDSFKLLEEINKHALKSNRIIHCLLQIHIADEETKYGLSYDEAKEILESTALQTMQNVCIKGFMGMATHTDDRTKIRTEFRNLCYFYRNCKEIYNGSNIDISELSMGMSGDYDIAIEEGSTLIRVGSSIFGDRMYNR
ncbi:MAG: YggS family pyridoxal phosphate-dependent enzyme [Cytophagaceae bacterium]|nr:YggS family pyridoxal phosphate-dependent enzyme [Cytophagaceae bacterium]MDW8455948.1 YggS family pyridoxal phosphate-dependent enzyme [Cytophagaceae bacterium]